MKSIRATGWGAVSSAGWDVSAMIEPCLTGDRVAPSTIERTDQNGMTHTTRVAPVPKLTDRSLLPADTRLRRAAPLGKYAAAAVYEALGAEKFEAAKTETFRVAIIAQIMNGCVAYSNRFYGEVLQDPATASPILFPETVYNAPSSHLSAMLHSPAPNDTLIGDAATWFTAVDLAAEWLLRDECDACIVCAMEELDWLNAEAVTLYHRSLVPSEGAAAVVFERSTEGIELLTVPENVGYAEEPNRLTALRRVWEQLDTEGDPTTLWSDGRCGAPRYDRAETGLVESWPGPRISARCLLGESMGAATGLQTVAALEMLKRQHAQRAVITAVGGNEGVGAAMFGNSNPT